MPDFVADTLARLKADGLHRTLRALASPPGPRITVEGREVLQFASNNYLGLANDPRVREALAKGVERWGWGAGASRLVAGHTDAHAALEADLAAFKGTEAALVFPTGYQANLAAISALVGRGDRVVGDRANHASIYDGVTLSGARLARYAHADAADAARVTAKAAGAGGRCLLATDTVFSMDGDTAPLAALTGLAREHGTMLLLDEAHATGLLGPTGAGLAEAVADGTQGDGPLLAEGIVSVGTLSKALGGVGGFVAASRGGVELLINRARPFIYTTALPAAACEAARAALAMVRSEPQRRRRVLALAGTLRARLRDAGFNAGASTTPIVPVLVGDPERALALASRLLSRGIFCPAIRPPSVPPGTSRLRVSLTSEHTEADVARLVEALGRPDSAPE